VITGSPAALPLNGIRVVEVSSFVAAPLCGMTLAQLGAEVIRVDPIGGAADYHRWPLAASGTSIYWTGLNKSKRSMAVDLRSAEGQQLVRRLIAEGDGILLTNAAGLSWLSYPQLKALRPDLIHLQVLGRTDGSTAVDYTINAATGFPLVTGPVDHVGPVNHTLPAWDVCCGLYAALALTVAVHTREKTGAGTQISVALEDVALATAGNLGFLTEAQVNGTSRERLGNSIFGQYGQDFTSSDGASFMVVALTARHFRDLVEVTGTGTAVSALAESLKSDFADEGDRYRHRDVLTALFGSWFGRRTAREITDALSATTVLFERYRDFLEVARDDRLTANPLFSKLNQEGLGEYLAPGLPISFDGAHPPVTVAPTLGEHTREILAAGLGLDQAEITRLSSAGTIDAGEGSR
jgi:2-methylfumaryl-CoA isomerase